MTSCLRAPGYCRVTPGQAVAATASGFCAGGINAVAGGGTLASFSALLALGVPAVSANVTNTVALAPWYLGGAVAQRSDLVVFATRLKSLLIVATCGGLVGSVLLVSTSDDVFGKLIPYLILGACALSGFQDRIKAWFSRRRAVETTTPRRYPVALAVAVFVGAVYGGYFGAELGIMLLAILGLALDDPLSRMNALKTTMSLVISVLAASFFVFSGLVQWNYAAIMALSSLIGGQRAGRSPVDSYTMCQAHRVRR